MSEEDAIKVTIETRRADVFQKRKIYSKSTKENSKLTDTNSVRDENINLHEFWPVENLTGFVADLKRALANKEWLRMACRGDVDAQGVDLANFMFKEFDLVPSTSGDAGGLAKLAEARTTSKLLIERAIAQSKISLEHKLSSIRNDPASDATPPPALPKAAPCHNILVKVSTAPSLIGA